MAYQHYPLWVTTSEGFRRQVKDHIEEERLTGRKTNPDGSHPEDKPEEKLPPTMEVIVAAGYSGEAAAGIYEEEQRKHAAGEKPHGDKEPTEDNPPPPAAQAKTEPAPEPTAAKPEPKKAVRFQPKEQSGSLGYEQNS